jgi:hypothetical protein
MSRPKPTVLLDFTEPKTYKSTQILAAEAVYAVFYDGNPINLRSLDKLSFNKNGKEPGPKYRKVSFSNSGHAFNLCIKLNTLFKTDKFQVVMLSNGDEIEKS